ncbi:class E vacuolar protein-sorting machinery protein hse1 [Podospora conica]|nr:class E vacuolar protein-sorting machinery protein hse1 [Schizothecium conicum]
MHQQPRHPPRVASPASSPQTNPARTNNPREAIASTSRARAGSEAMGSDRGRRSIEVEGGDGGSLGFSKESIKKLDQIIQNFFHKTSTLVLQSRLGLIPPGGRKPEERKPNKWFQIETEDTDDFKDELRVYRMSGAFENRAPPMIIETYLDASRLSSSQSLVIVDEQGKRWDVLEALNSSETSSDDSRTGRGQQRQKRNTEVALPFDMREDFGPQLPTIYKRSIVFFRSLFIATRIMPCFKYSQQALAKGSNPVLEVKCRVLTADPARGGIDLLRQPLYDGSRDVVTEYALGELDVPAGRFCASVAYRNDYNFRVDDSESLLSSRFMGGRGHARRESYAEPGSLPARRQHRMGPQEVQQQTYGSLSTPISALKAVRPMGSGESESVPIRGSVGRPPLRNADGSSRRPSVSFQPFKAGSLSGSPRIPDSEVPSSPQSYPRPSPLSRPGNRSSLTAGMASSLRGPPAVPQEVPQVTGSPRPASRYSSSFTHRRNRPSFGGQSKGDDDQGSSGKQSLSSSAQPGSGLLTEAGGAASSGSFATDDDNISDFEPNKKGESSASKRTAAQLSKFQQMREANNVLTESMTSSMHLHRSSSAMVGAASPLSPHTPHTPAIPSRLSENSIIDYQPDQDRNNNNGQRRRPLRHAAIIPTEEEDADNETPVSQGGATAIDIPLSPRLLQAPDNNTTATTAGNRRASSVAQGGHRASTGPDDSADIAQRSLSLGADDRLEVPPTMSELISFRNDVVTSSSLGLLQPAADIRMAEEAAPREGEAKGEGESPGLLAGAQFRGVRYAGGRSRAAGQQGGSSRGSFSGGRFGAGARGEEGDEEPLVFAMSELERPSRRSLEDGEGRGEGALTMFRAAAVGPYDEAINKATDENLTSEDWGQIMEVCDRVQSDANGSKEAVQSLIKRLAHRNANVQLYTLEVANALSQNCGKPMHRELSSRAFTDALLKLANDRNTHNQVKAKILERMKEWSDMFKSDPDLGIMYDAYFRLKQSNPSLQPPSAPQKNNLTDIDRQKEEDELQMALKLSLQEEERKKAPSSSQAGPSGSGRPNGAGPSAQASTSQAAPAQPTPTGTTAATVSRVRALFDFVPSEPGELEFKKGDVIAVLESVFKDWWRGSLKGKTGIFPLNYVEKLTDPTPDELQREAQMEAEVFAEIKNVEKLLTLLSASNTAPREEDNEEISKLYHQTLAIRPKLIKLIEKYSQKKDDFTQLNEKFIKARRDYEALLESSMAHPPGPSYYQYPARPQPQGYPAPGPGYGQHDPQRFYTPAPAQEPTQYPTSPSPNSQRPGPPYYGTGPDGGQAPPQGVQQPPQGQPQQASQQPPYPQMLPEQRRPSGGRQPTPLDTSSSPTPPANQYTPYSAPVASTRPQSYGGAPQELSTSAYDSPIAPHGSNPAAAPGPGSTVIPPQPSAPPPSAPSAPTYGQYAPYQAAQPYGGGYDAPPPAPLGQAPPVPQGQGQGRPPMSPSLPGTGPGGFDACQTLPSHGRMQQQPQQQGGQPQYKAYVPPGAGSAPGEGPSAPSDYYEVVAR